MDDAYQNCQHIAFAIKKKQQQVFPYTLALLDYSINQVSEDVQFDLVPVGWHGVIFIEHVDIHERCVNSPLHSGVHL